ncbi:cytochrome P450, partial [Fomitopsis serialis]|uniref:cytochrome P450 n=1 Tax=Fomitopsis serialis TaxID=139415 RepID=UPI002007A4F7
LSQALIALVITWILWRAIRSRLVFASLRKLRGPRSSSFVTGNLKQWFSREGDGFQKHVALEYGSVVKIHGMMGRPILYVSDPKALHAILIKEEPIYQESRAFIDSLLQPPLLKLDLGQYHAKQRKLLNPVFSITHMRRMLPIFYNVVYKLRDAMRTTIEGGKSEMDVLGWTVRVALELIGQGGLGYSFDPLVEDKRDPFADAIKAFNPKMVDLAVLRRFIPYLRILGPAWFRRILVDLLPRTWIIRQVVDLVDTINSRSEQIYEAKKAVLRQGDEVVSKQLAEGKDIMSILMRANMAANESERLPEEEVLAQITTFTFAALETTSSTLARILHLLSINKDVQQKLREELIEARAAEGIPYDELDGLPLLDSVCRETLRLYPPATNIVRVAQKDNVIPLSQPITTSDGQTLNELFVPQGTEILIGTYASNVRQDLWGPDASSGNRSDGHNFRPLLRTHVYQVFTPTSRYRLLSWPEREHASASSSPRWK